MTDVSWHTWPLCVCVCIYVCCCMVVVGLEVVRNETRQCVACCLLRLCYAVTAECMFLTGCMIFTTWLSFFLAQFPLPQDGLLSILSKFLVQGTSARRAPPPSSQPCAPRHMPPHLWRTVGYPPQRPGWGSIKVCVHLWLGGFMKLPTL